MQAFAYYHLVPSEKLYISPAWEWNSHLFRWQNMDIITIKRGSSATIKLKAGQLPLSGNPTIDSIEPVDPPRGVTVSDLKHENGTISFKLNIAADGDAFERNQLFLLRASSDTPPNKRGVISRRKNIITLPVRRVIAK